MRGIGLLVLVLGIAVAIVPASAMADTERRVALIIGNDSYKSLKRLDNGVNDARAMAAELKAAGFETVLKVNAGRKEMHTAIGEFGGKLASGSVGLFYFAGHGIQAGDRNFLVPVDAELQSEDDLDADAIDAGKVMRAMEAAHNRVNIVILDACRDNPLPKGGRSGSRGLAVVQAPTGTLVAYATGPGKVAQDGDRGGNGVYTGELVKALRQPGLKIEDVFKKAAAGVMEKTGGKQVPWTQASLSGDFYFRPPSGPQPVVRNEGGGGGGGTQAEIVFWQSVKDSRKAADFADYLDQFPNGTFAGLARRRIEELKGGQVASLVPPRPEPTLDAMDREMVAGRKASMRDAPDAKAKLVATLSEGDTIQVTGKVRGENWYSVERKGSRGYVVTETLEEPSAYKARKDREEQAAAAPPPPPPKVSSGSRSPGGVFRDCPDCPEMVVIPPGRFLMGSNDGDADEKPVHAVAIPRAFAVGKYEVTRGAFASFVRETGHPPGDGCKVWDGKSWIKRDELNWQNPGFSQAERDPVVCVSWLDAQAFLSWLNRKVRAAATVSTGGSGPYRLLTEAEWEYTARAGTTTKWSCGNHEGCLASVAVYAGNSGNRTAPVGSKSGNDFGLHDMHGNVWEWVEDCHADSYAGAPSDGSATTETASCKRGNRGGSWSNGAGLLGVSFRDRNNPSFRYTNQGFRLARALP